MCSCMYICKGNVQEWSLLIAETDPKEHCVLMFIRHTTAIKPIRLSLYILLDAQISLFHVLAHVKKTNGSTVGVSLRTVFAHCFIEVTVYTGRTYS